MKLSDFKEITEEHINTCKFILGKDGDCWAMECRSCPFDDDNRVNKNEYCKFSGKPHVAVVEEFLKLIEEDKMEEFTKEDLKTGMVVRLRNDSMYLVMRGAFVGVGYDNKTLLFINSKKRIFGISYNDDLRFWETGDDPKDIIKVYMPEIVGISGLFGGTSDADLIWSRIEKSEDELKLEEMIKTIDKLGKEAEGLKESIRNKQEEAHKKGRTYTRHYRASDGLLIKS